jgi:hypothetical protein
MPADSSPNLGRHKVTARLSPTGALSLRQFKDGDDLAFWAHRRAPAKDTLTAEGARAVETAYRKFPDPANLMSKAGMSKAGRLQVRPETNSDGAAAANGSAVADQASSAAEMVRRLRRSGGAAVQFQRPADLEVRPMALRRARVSAAAACAPIRLDAFVCLTL